jgi:hypothetical protein
MAGDFEVKLMNDDAIHVKTERDKLHIIRSTLPIFQYQGFQHVVEDTDSVIGLVKRYGAPENTLIFVNKDRIHVIFDDTIQDRPQDTAECEFVLSDQANDWHRHLSNSIEQKKFIDFLRCRPEEEIENLDALLAAVKVLKITTEIIGDYELDDRGNITFMYKSREKEGKCSIPSVINVRIPMLNNGSVMSIEMELEIIKPKSEQEKPAFKITCPKWSRYYKEAVEAEIEKLKRALPEYSILAG